MANMHYWLVSAPAENGSKEETWKKLNNATAELSENYKLKIPELRVGTLDSLMSLSDDLDRIDRCLVIPPHASFAPPPTRLMASRFVPALGCRLRGPWSARIPRTAYEAQGA